MITNMENVIAEIKKEFQSELKQVSNKDELQKLEKKFLKISIKDLYNELATITDLDIKKRSGKKINDLKSLIAENINNTRESMLLNNIKSKVEYDYSIRKANIKRGGIHPLTKLYKEIENVFINMGFSIVQGPEIELDKNNFEKLNMPEYHPARDMQDTFYIAKPNILLRSHTSCVQIRTMEKIKPPFKIMSPGTVYRVDDIDPQHTPMFYQIEGLVVGEKIAFSDLKGVLTSFIQSVFGSSTEVRFRPSYYPYTEPSAAMDMSCIICNKKGCRTCNDSGWVTILGSGMVHPNVFENVNYDSAKYTGFAFGLGLNRLALIYFGLSEIRKLYENDILLWEQL